MAKNGRIDEKVVGELNPLNLGTLCWMTSQHVNNNDSEIWGNIEWKLKKLPGLSKITEK